MAGADTALHGPNPLPEAMQRSVAVTTVTVVPMSRPGLIHDQTVIIERGRITEVGDAAGVRVPSDALVVDGSGRFLMPGLADMHAHYGDAGQFIMFLAGGVTRIRNMWGGEFHLAMVERTASGAFPGPHINTTGPITDRPVRDGKGIYPGTALIEDPRDAAALVAGFARAGYHAVKVYSYLTPECLRALGKAAADQGLPMVGHCPTGMSFEEAMDAGMTSLEHLLEIGKGHLHDGIDYPPMAVGGGAANHLDRMRLEIEMLDREAVRRLSGEMAARNVWNCPTITVMAQFAKPPEEALAGPGMQYLPSATRHQWARRATRAQGDSPEEAAAYADLQRRSVELSIELVGLMHAEGAPLLLGTDAGSPLTPQGFTIADELRFFSDAGLSGFDVLATGTTAVARYLGRDDFGTVEVGKLADLLLVDTDPLIDPAAAVERISAVFSNGFMFERAELDRLLAWREATADATVELPENELGPMANKTWWAR